MPWTRSRKTIAAIVFVLLAVMIVASIVALANRMPANRQQRLDDGSLLTLTRVEFGTNIDFPHGNFVQKLLGNAISSNGVRVGKFILKRPTHRPSFGLWGKDWLVVEFNLAGPGSTNNPLVKSAFYRQFRYVIYGETGIEYVQELWGEPFQSYSDGFYGYVMATSFPRDSRWLGLRVEKRPSAAKPEPWQTVADFKFKNPAQPAHKLWVAEPAPIVKTTNGMDFVLGQVTVKVVPHLTNDIWNHIVDAPFEVRSNGVALTNWHAMYVHAEDASGNWDYFQNWRSLDPRFVWKLEADFELKSNFPAGTVATVDVPLSLNQVLVTNVAGVPVSLSWVNGGMLSGQIPTNRTDCALVFVDAQDEMTWGRSGSWQQHGFWKETRPAAGARTLKATIAVVPNVHVTFYTQPQLVTNQLQEPP